MTTIHVCDECGKRLPAIALRVAVTRDGNEGIFLDGSWNGGDFCGSACAIACLGKLREPGVATGMGERAAA